MHTNGYHTHMHNYCKHDFIQYCEHCNICYCTKCGKEWGEKVTFTYTYDPYVWTYRGVPYTVTYSNSGDYSLTTSNGTAVKDASTIAAFYSSTTNESSNNAVHTHTTKS